MWSQQLIDAFFEKIDGSDVLDLALFLHQNPVPPETMQDIAGFRIPFLNTLDGANDAVIECVLHSFETNHLMYTKELMLVGAIHEKCIHLVRSLVKMGADVNFGKGSYDSPIYACMLSHSSVALKIILTHGADPNKMIGIETPLSLATRMGDTKSIKLLKEYGGIIETLIKPTRD